MLHRFLVCLRNAARILPKLCSTGRINDPRQLWTGNTGFHSSNVVQHSPQRTGSIRLHRSDQFSLRTSGMRSASIPQLSTSRDLRRNTPLSHKKPLFFPILNFVEIEANFSCNEIYDCVAGVDASPGATTAPLGFLRPKRKATRAATITA